MKTLPIGISDFRNLREQNSYFVDKSLLIQEVAEAGDKVIVIPRPRRFGKTLNMSMLRYFFDIHGHDNGHRALFTGLAIEQWSGFEAHFAAYPVLSLSMRKWKDTSFERIRQKIDTTLSQLYGAHTDLAEYLLPDSKDARLFDQFVNATTSQITDYDEALTLLMRLLQAKHGKPVWVLIDEYDEPIHSAYLGGFYEPMVQLMRGMLGSALKDEASLYKGVVTGITRVAKASIFSGLNNVSVCDMLSYRFSHYFGFTDSEVQALCDYYHVSEQMDTIRDWYNGYNIGHAAVYNPWSVLNYILELPAEPMPHWANTSDNALLSSVLRDAPREVFHLLQDLVAGHTIYHTLAQQVVFAHMRSDAATAFAFLLSTGYLKAKFHKQDDLYAEYALSIPNKEVMTIYQQQILLWFRTDEADSFGKILLLLTSNMIDDFFDELRSYVVESLSYFDVKGKTPERMYQAFMLGMLLMLRGKYRVLSNRESGLGRFDIALVPVQPGQRGFVMELKRARLRRGGTLVEHAEAGLAQIATKQYDAELRSMGIGQITHIAIAFEGKELAGAYRVADA